VVGLYLLGLRKRSSSGREESIRDGSLTFNSFMEWIESSALKLLDARLGEFDGDGVRIFRSPETLPPLKFLALTHENGFGFTILLTAVMDPPEEFGAITLFPPPRRMMGVEVKGTTEAMEDNPIPPGLLLLLLLVVVVVLMILIRVLAGAEVLTTLELLDLDESEVLWLEEGDVIMLAF